MISVCVLYLIYILSISIVYVYKSRTIIGQYKPIILFIATFLTSITDIISCILYDTNIIHFKLLNFVLSHFFTCLILSLTLYRFVSFYINNIRIKNIINNNNNKIIDNKYKKFIILLFSFCLLTLIYSILIVLNNKNNFSKNNWQYYPIYFISISFFLIIMPIIIYILTNIYQNIYECYLTLSMGFLGTLLVIIFDNINIKINTQYILVLSNIIIISFLYFIPLYKIYNNKKTDWDNKSINIDTTRINFEEINFLEKYNILKKIIEKHENNINTLLLNFYDENVIQLKKKYNIDEIEINIKKDTIEINIFDKLKNDILNNVYCNLYKYY